MRALIPVSIHFVKGSLNVLFCCGLAAAVVVAQATCIIVKFTIFFTESESVLFQDVDVRDLRTAHN